MEQKQVSVPVFSFDDYDSVAFKSSELNVLLCLLLSSSLMNYLHYTSQRIRHRRLQNV